MIACRAATASWTCHSELGGEVELYSRVLTVSLDISCCYIPCSLCVLGQFALFDSVGWSLVDMFCFFLDSFFLVVMKRHRRIEYGFPIAENYFSEFLVKCQSRR